MLDAEPAWHVERIRQPTVPDVGQRVFGSLVVPRFAESSLPGCSELVRMRERYQWAEPAGTLDCPSKFERQQTPTPT